MMVFGIVFSVSQMVKEESGHLCIYFFSGHRQIYSSHEFNWIYPMVYSYTVCHTSQLIMSYWDWDGI